MAGAAVAVFVGNQGGSPTRAPPRKRGPATPLHFAAQKGDTAATLKLLETGASVDASTKLGATPLHVASEQGMMKVAQLLLKYGADADARTDAGLTPLSFTAEQGSLDIMRLLISSGANLDLPTASGHTPLHIASQKGNVEVVTTLLDGKASISAQTNLGHTALHLAALVSETATITLLAARGAPLDAQTVSGHSPMHIAAQKGHIDVVELLLQHDKAVTLDGVTKMGHTPLMVALDEAQDEVAGLLLRSGANASVRDSRGVTPLHLAARRGALNMITVLIANGANVNGRSSGGLSPLDVAVYGAPTAGGTPLAGGTLSADGAPTTDEKMVKLLDPLTTAEALIDGGADVSATHPWTGQTAMHAAAYLGRSAWLNLMRSNGGSAATNDAQSHLQRGDGLEQRAQSTGRAAPSSLMRVARVRAAACDEYKAAINLAPTNAMAYTRLGAVQARLEDGQGQQAEGALSSYRHAWRLMSGGEADAEAFATAEVDLALAGLTNDERQRPARTPDQLAVHGMHSENRAGTRRALGLWRQQGVVVFPGLLNQTTLHALRAHAQRALDLDHGAAVERTANIRAPVNRTLRALSVREDGAAKALEALATSLGPFLRHALMDSKALLLELAVMRAAGGAAEQAWHRDDGILDRRTASVQIALVDTAADQGSFEVQPGTHTNAEQPNEQNPGLTVAATAGTVTIYTPNVVHRGRANTLVDDRLTTVLTLMGASGLVPNGIPLAIEPEDAGRWWMEGGQMTAVTRAAS